MEILNKINKLIFLNKTHVLVLLLLSSLSQASLIIIVTATDETVADDGLCSIVEAIISANTDTASGATTGECVAGVTGLDTIELAVDVTLSTFYDDIILTYVDPDNNTILLNIGRTATPAIESEIILDGMGFSLERDPSNTCTLDTTEATGEFRLMRLHGSAANLSLRNITLKGGCADGPANHNGVGGGVYVEEGILNIENSIINNNQSSLAAGGVYLLDVKARINLVTTSTFISNKSGFGGAIGSNGVIETIENSMFSNNVATISNGGAVYNNGSLTTLNNSVFSVNNANSNGGGIYITTIGTIMDINNSIFSTNSADGNTLSEGGGGVYNGGTITAINNSTFSGNSANNGSGIYNTTIGTIMDINNSTFSDNSAFNFGGGVNNNGTITAINNSTFSGNSAGYGGGIINAVTITEINNSTFFGNSAVINGGGIENSGNSANITMLNNSLFIENTGTNADCNNDGGSVSGSNNLSNQQSNNCSNADFISGLDLSTVGPLADNGCMTPLANGTCVKTHALLAGSVAINLGDVNATNNDQRGFVLNGVRDIGAFERQTAQGQCSQNQADAIFNVSSALELNDAIICANQNVSTTDTINFTQNITLNTHYDDITTGPNPMGKTGTQAIESAITINGNGYRLQRNPNINCVLNDTKETGEFRLMRLQGNNANLSLKHIVLEGGCADGPVTHNGIAGGIYAEGGTLSIENSLLDKNQAKNVAGAVYLIDAATTLTVLDSTFSFNKSGKGGALYSNGIIAKIENSTFSGNEANGYLSESQGGAIWNNNQISDILNNTFSGNKAVNNAPIGGALYTAVGHTISQMNNNLFHNNTATTNADCYEFTPTNVTGSYNMSNLNSSNCTAYISSFLDTAEISPLADNGCVTPLADGTCIKTHALSIFALAVNSGVNATNHDQRGFVPVQERDLGAFESSSYDDVLFKNSFE